MKPKRKINGFLSALLVGLISACLISCSDDEKPKTIPEVTTAAITGITTTTAMGGGEIVSDGNAEITASGLVYSSTNTTPTIADSKTEETATSGTFTSALEGLISGTTYYVRAYATNNVGTGYGDVVTFTTGNAAPAATDVAITGNINVGAELAAFYTYSDAESDAEGGTTFQWYVATDGSGSSEMAIAGATAGTYTIQPEDEFKYIRVGVTPMASTGTTAGEEVKSGFAGPVQPETVTFMYNGEEVTYGVITSSVTGRKWMDRNLGAQAAATGMQDHLGYGDLFQWGRLADGHQLITWTQDVLVGSSVPVNGTTSTQSSNDVPGHSLFIVLGSSPVVYDWRNPQNANLWQASSYTNNPCPDGWHIPTEAEWDAENIHLLAGNELKLTANGGRRWDNGNLQNNSPGPGRQGYYWSSTLINAGGANYPTLYDFRLDTSGAIPYASYNWRKTADVAAYGYSCRCIKHE